ncbi:MAG: phosphatidylserine/phosphatidylglycerophosphate/cardiolipin synthase family protein [Methylotenera sp.]|nr:phosphatidylserine/phosphatidylglycerophosphate/cardiolipin synthase family protein [Oligoflexia bacterium]
MKTGVLIATFLIVWSTLGLPLSAAQAAPATVLEQVRLLENDFDAEKAHIEMIDRAGTTPGLPGKIRAGYFIFESDIIGGQRLAAYIRAARRGVNVQLILDDYMYHLSEALVNYLETQGVHVVVYNQFDAFRPIESKTQRFHLKYENIDGVEMITEGRNVSANYYAPRHGDPKYDFTDRSVWIKGHVAWENAQFHDELWASEYVAKKDYGNKLPVLIERGKRLMDQYEDILKGTREHLSHVQYEYPIMEIEASKIQLMTDNFHDKSSFGVYDQILRGIETAQTRITGETPYLLAPDKMDKAFSDAVKRNVPVKLTTNSRDAMDEEYVAIAYNDQMNHLLEGKVGIEVFMEKGTLHAKAMVFDGHVTYLMTANLNGRSAHTDLEMGVIIDHRELADIVEANIRKRDTAKLTTELLHTSREYALRVKGFWNKCEALLKVQAAKLLEDQL